ncbi:hypothetical protein, partial [Aeromonas veronii]|uniref:hypothetical protein n=1 Tax=Aeromonas veronii TaxID=654 RepID=UPI0038B646EA
LTTGDEVLIGVGSGSESRGNAIVLSVECSSDAGYVTLELARQCGDHWEDWHRNHRANEKVVLLKRD